MPDLNNNLLSFSINTLFQSLPTAQSPNQCHMFSVFVMRAPISVPVFYCCITNYHKIKYPKQLFYLLKIWRFRIWMTSAGQLVCLICLWSAGVTGAGYPLPRWSYVSLMSSISVLLGLSLGPRSVSFSRSSSQGFDFSQHGALRVATLLPGGWLPRVSVPNDRKWKPSTS